MDEHDYRLLMMQQSRRRTTLLSLLLFVIMLIVIVGYLVISSPQQNPEGDTNPSTSMEEERGRGEIEELSGTNGYLVYEREEALEKLTETIANVEKRFNYVIAETERQRTILGALDEAREELIRKNEELEELYLLIDQINDYLGGIYGTPEEDH